jgi:hypothetical protein
VTSTTDMERICLESLYEFSEGMPDGCTSADPDCRSVRWWKVDGHWTCGRCQMYFDPLLNDEHAMKLVKAHKLAICHSDKRGWEVAWFDPKSDNEIRVSAQTLNLAIVECVVQAHATGHNTAKDRS